MLPHRRTTSKLRKKNSSANQNLLSISIELHRTAGHGPLPKSLPRVAACHCLGGRGARGLTTPEWPETGQLLPDFKGRCQRNPEVGQIPIFSWWHLSPFRDQPTVILANFGLEFVACFCPTMVIACPAKTWGSPTNMRISFQKHRDLRFERKTWICSLKARLSEHPAEMRQINDSFPR